jgi:ketosteroid isomerase-like protein
VSQVHEEVVRDIFRNWAVGAFGSREHFDDHALFLVSEDFPEAGVFVGPAAMADYMRRFLQQWERVAFDVDGLEAFGDTVLARVVQISTGAASGLEGEIRLFILFTFRGSKVVRMEVILREADALEALG